MREIKFRPGDSTREDQYLTDHCRKFWLDELRTLNSSAFRSKNAVSNALMLQTMVPFRVIERRFDALDAVAEVGDVRLWDYIEEMREKGEDDGDD